jgi:phosphoglycolate phosphatase-like HAD superfamily hydrolase
MLLALDLDGTLIDARRRQVMVARHAVKELTARVLKDHPFWELKRAGASTEQALVKLGYAQRLAADIAGLWKQEIESDRWLAHDRALPGTVEVLGGLRAQGVAIVVLTARQRFDGAAGSLEYAGLTSLVDELVVVDPESAAASKARSLAERRPRAFIGDTVSDGSAAAAAGVPFVAVATGQCSPGQLYSSGYRVAPTLRHAVSVAIGRRAPAVAV